MFRLSLRLPSWGRDEIPPPPSLNAHMHTEKSTAWIMCTVAVRDRTDGAMVENVQLEVRGLGKLAGSGEQEASLVSRVCNKL